MCQAPQLFLSLVLTGIYRAVQLFSTLTCCNNNCVAREMSKIVHQYVFCMPRCYILKRYIRKVWPNRKKLEFEFTTPCILVHLKNLA